jgi:hypothetical protein
MTRYINPRGGPSEQPDALPEIRLTLRIAGELAREIDDLASKLAAETGGRYSRSAIIRMAVAELLHNRENGQARRIPLVFGSPLEWDPVISGIQAFAELAGQVPTVERGPKTEKKP